MGSIFLIQQDYTINMSTFIGQKSQYLFVEHNIYNKQLKSWLRLFSSIEVLENRFFSRVQELALEALIYFIITLFVFHIEFS